MDLDPLTTTGAVPSFIDATKSVTKRLTQVADLLDVIHHGGREKKPRTVMQRLPRHMRRRAMSHNIKRLPRKVREFGKAVIAKSKHRKKPPSRLRRRRPKNLQKVYRKRSFKEFRWMATHIFHAKRFEMTSLWGHKVPLRSYQRGIRPFFKAAKDHTVMFDDSYYSLVQIKFNNNNDCQNFIEEISRITSDDYFSLKVNTCPTSSVTVVYRNESEVVISVHPIFAKDVVQFFALFGLTVELAEEEKFKEQCKKHDFATELPINCYIGQMVTIFSISNLYSQFTFYGATTLKSLSNLLHLVSDSDLEKENLPQFKELHQTFKDLVDSNSINTVKDGSTLAFLVEDPRLQKAVKLERTVMTSDKQFNGNLSTSGTLFDRARIEQFISKHLSHLKISEVNKTSLAKVTTSKFKIPLILVILNTGKLVSFKLLLPSLTANYFISTIYRSGIRVGSLSDRFQLTVENEDSRFPFFWLPLTYNKAAYRWKRYKKLKEVEHDKFGKFNDWSQWEYLICNSHTLSLLQAFIDGKINIKHDEFPKHLLAPVKITVTDKASVHDDDFIYELKHVEKVVEAEKEVPERVEETLFMEFKSVSSIGVESLFEAPKAKKPKVCKPEIDAPKERQLLGKLVYSRASLYHGVTEALGYVDIGASLEFLRKTKGKVHLKNPNSPKFVKAQLKFIFTC